MITKYYSGDQIKKNEMGDAYDIFGRGEMHREFSWGNLRERSHLEDLGIGGRIIFKMDVQEMGWNNELD